jgi:hypothetical protein
MSATDRQPRPKGRPSSAQREAWREAAPSLAQYETRLIDGAGFLAKLITKQSIAQFFHVSEETVDTWVRDFKLPVMTLPDTSEQAVPVLMFIDAFLANSPGADRADPDDVAEFRREALTSLRLMNEAAKGKQLDPAHPIFTSMARALASATVFLGGGDG